MEDVKIRIQPKKLPSGKCQVRFEAYWPNSGSCYGYMLTEADTPLREMMGSLQAQLGMMRDKDRFFHTNLYSLPIAPIQRAKALWIMGVN
jgi:hypothetical protein